VLAIHVVLRRIATVGTSVEVPINPMLAELLHENNALPIPIVLWERFVTLFGIHAVLTPLVPNAIRHVPRIVAALIFDAMQEALASLFLATKVLPARHFKNAIPRLPMTRHSPFTRVHPDA
jgi:hypothetical protein